MRDSLAQTTAAYAAGLCAWSGWYAASGARRPRALAGGLVVLECALILHGALGLWALASGSIEGETGVYGGYLAASVVLLPAVAAGATDPRSRWDSVVLAIGSVAVAVLALRMLAIAHG
jgi:hypothetical protein